LSARAVGRANSSFTVSSTARARRRSASGITRSSFAWAAAAALAAEASPSPRDATSPTESATASSSVNYWADSRRGILEPPVVGSFDGDVGTFYGDDVFEGRPIRVRFLWTRGASPRWEQAYSADGGKTWETNWTMDMTREERPARTPRSSPRSTTGRSGRRTRRA
jgi:hypothetical protein